MSALKGRTAFMCDGTVKQEANNEPHTVRGNLSYTEVNIIKET